MDFEECLAAILYHEGGYYDGSDPRDPNPTNKGITQDTYNSFRKSLGVPEREVRYMQDVEMAAIYRGRYWRDGKCDKLPTGINLIHFDFSVNSGITQAAKTLQRCVGVTVDGIIGPKTLEAVFKFNPLDLIFDYSQARRKFYETLASNKPKLKPNLKGWLKRTADIERRAIKAVRRTLPSSNSV